MSAIKQKLYTVKNRVNWKWTFAFILIVSFAYLGHQNLIDWVLLPTFNWLYSLPIIGGAIDWLMLYGGAETWNWHSITASAMIAIITVVFGYFWGRHSIEIVEVNQDTAVETTKSEPPASATPIDYKAEYEKLAAKLEQEKAE